MNLGEEGSHEASRTGLGQLFLSVNRAKAPEAFDQNRSPYLTTQLFTIQSPQQLQLVPTSVRDRLTERLPLQVQRVTDFSEGRGMIAISKMRTNLIGLTIALSLLVGSHLTCAAKQEAAGSNIDIQASPEVVFEAIRKQRNSTEQHRTLQSFNGKVAVIEEKMENVPVYGRVDCTYEETEDPYKRIDYKMLKSSKFKSGFGTWALTPSADGKSTNLEFKSFTDSGLPFMGGLTKMESVKTAKIRLQHIKEVAEAMQKEKPKAKEKEKEKETKESGK